MKDDKSRQRTFLRNSPLPPCGLFARAARRALRAAIVCVVAGVVSGCASGISAWTQSVQLLMQRGPNVDAAELPPDYFFLRVTIRGHTAILGLAQVDPHPDGRIAVWTNALGEVLRIQEGRLIGAVGLPTEWRGVVLPKLPTWPEIAALNAPFRWVRVRDVMPGYRFGIRDELVVRTIPPPEKSGLRAVDPHTLTWFEEHLNPAAASPFVPGGVAPADAALPPARYAVRMSTQTVLYAEQCLAPDLCIAWQRWSSELQRANKETALSATQ